MQYKEKQAIGQSGLNCTNKIMKGTRKDKKDLIAHWNLVKAVKA